MQKLLKLQIDNNKKCNRYNNMNVNEHEAMEQVFVKYHGEILSGNKLFKLKRLETKEIELLQSVSQNISDGESEAIPYDEMDDLLGKCIDEILDEHYPICNHKKRKKRRKNKKKGIL